MSGPPPIEARGLRKVFRQATTGQSVVAIDRLDLTIAPREVVAIVGQTGCGKSTFFDLMIGLEAPTEGTLNIGDKSPFADFDHFRGRIATVFQQDRLLAWRSALDNAKLPLELIGLPEAEQRERALTWLNRLGLGNFTNAYPHELSGGMRQRVAIARAFVVQPDILLADEAFGHLDEVTAAELRETFLQLARECGSTAVLITHQLEEAIGVGDRIVVFGKSAKLLADIHVAQWPKASYAVLREAIQATLQANSPDPRLGSPAALQRPEPEQFSGEAAAARSLARMLTRHYAANFTEIAADRLQRKVDAALVLFQKHRRGQRAADDELPGAQLVADRGGNVRHMAHDVENVADIGFEIGRHRHVVAAARDAALEACEPRALAHDVALAEDDMALEDVAGEDRLHVVHRAVDIGKLDRGTDGGDRPCARRRGWHSPAGPGPYRPRSPPRRPASAS